MILLVLLAVWFANNHIWASFQPDRILVRTVGKGLQLVHAPADGVFARAKQLEHGSQVREGELLGRISAPQLEDQREQLEADIYSLKAALLRHDRRQIGGESADNWLYAAQFQNDLVLRLQHAQIQLANVRHRLEKLAVYAPIDGTVYYGVGLNQATENDKTIIAQIWPSNGDVAIEIDAPWAAAIQILRQSQIRCRFDTPQGIEAIVGEPIPSSLKSYYEAEPIRQRKVAWATLRCRPLALPRSLQQPGVVGVIQR